MYVFSRVEGCFATPKLVCAPLYWLFISYPLVPQAQQPEATALVSLSGIRYRGAALEITCLEATGARQGVGGPVCRSTAGVGQQQLPEHLKGKLQQALGSLYNAQAQMLVCDNLEERFSVTCCVTTLSFFLVTPRQRFFLVIPCHTASRISFLQH